MAPVVSPVPNLKKVVGTPAPKSKIRRSSSASDIDTMDTSDLIISKRKSVIQDRKRQKPITFKTRGNQSTLDCYKKRNELSPSKSKKAQSQKSLLDSLSRKMDDIKLTLNSVVKTEELDDKLDEKLRCLVNEIQLK